MSITNKIQNVVKGRTPTLLNTELANELIDKVNASDNIQITRSSYDAVVVGSDGIIITLKDYDALKDDAEINASTVPMWVCLNGEALIKNIYFEADT